MQVKLAAQVYEAQKTAHPERDECCHALIILHGLFGSASNWRGISRELSLERRARARSA